jgi:hypothetical protein
MVRRIASYRARRPINSSCTSARDSARGAAFGSALGLPCTKLLASPAFGGTLAVVAAPLMPWASWRNASLFGRGASDTGELVVLALGAPMVWVLASPALGGTSVLPEAEVLCACAPAATRPASSTGR